MLNGEMKMNCKGKREKLSWRNKTKGKRDEKTENAVWISIWSTLSHIRFVVIALALRSEGCSHFEETWFSCKERIESGLLIFHRVVLVSFFARWFMICFDLLSASYAKCRMVIVQLTFDQWRLIAWSFDVFGVWKEDWWFSGNFFGQGPL